MEKSLNHKKVSDLSNVPSIKTCQKVGSHAWGIPSGLNAQYGFSDASLFSSSLPVFLHEKFQVSQDLRMDDASAKMKKLNDDVKRKDLMDDFDLQPIGNLLPDDEDELLAGIIDDFDPVELPPQLEELEEYDVFGSGGGMELDSDTTEGITISLAKASLSDSYAVNGINQYNFPNGVGTVAGEHPYGEHPSRTLFVRNINSNVEDSELRSLFEAYGDIRNLYTATKHRGFVMISYYDIRDARTAMRALQNKPLRRRKLDIHFSIPKDNPSDKDMNQGTLVIFNLEPSVSNDELREIFGAYGEVKEIRETPHKRHHKFIEFYDVRAAEAALRSLNKSDIAGKRIKLEPSRPGGARRNLMQQLTHELEQDEPKIYRHHGASPITNSPPGTWAQFSSPDNSPLQGFSKSPSGGTMSPIGGSHLSGLASIPPLKSNSLKIPPIGKDANRVNFVERSNVTHGVALQDNRSFTEHSSGFMSSSQSTPFGPPMSSASGIGTLTGPQFLWGSPNPYSEQTKPSWQSPPVGHSFLSNGHAQGQVFSYSNHQGSFLGSSDHHRYHVGSAPSGVPLESHFGYFPESPEVSFMGQAKFGSMGTSRNGGGLMMNLGAQTMSPAVTTSGNPSYDNLSNFQMMMPHRLGHTFFGNASYSGPGSVGVEGLVERGGNRHIDNSGNQSVSKEQYQLDLEKIISGKDTRTTLMIKNIPNKYTSKMLLTAIDENHEGTYDFFYLPIDFKNRCNVGYAFINMVSPGHIISFYQAFNGKKWEKFNSEKVVSLAYARIQGRAALISHFQNSSLMNEDKRCRPILFHSKGPEAGNQVPFPLNGANVRMLQQDGSVMGEDSLESLTKSNPREKPEDNSLPGSSLEQK